MSSRSRSSRKTPVSYVEAYSDASIEPWVETFCRRRGNEYFCEVPEDFLLDKFNLTNLGIETSSKLDSAYKLIIDDFSTAHHYDCIILTDLIGGEVDENGNIPADIESTAKKLYGIIHQRFIQTPQGIAAMVLFTNHVHILILPCSIRNM